MIKKEEILISDLYKNFSEGDLVYGLSPVRNQYSQCIQQEKKYPFVTIDQINNKLFIRNRSDEKTGYVKDYADFLSTTKYDPALYQKKKYLPLDEEEGYIRRSCKAAINWPVRTIHFCLDKIQFDPFVFKKFDLSTGKIDVGYTIGELRWIYRHRSEINNTIIFYEKGKVSLAPWEGKENEMIWKEKYLSKPHEHLDQLNGTYKNKVSFFKKDVLATPKKITARRTAYNQLAKCNKRILFENSNTETDTTPHKKMAFNG